MNVLVMLPTSKTSDGGHRPRGRHVGEAGRTAPRGAVRQQDRGLHAREVQSLDRRGELGLQLAGEAGELGQRPVGREARGRRGRGRGRRRDAAWPSVRARRTARTRRGEVPAGTLAVATGSSDGVMTGALAHAADASPSRSTAAVTRARAWRFAPAEPRGRRHRAYQGSPDEGSWSAGERPGRLSVPSAGVASPGARGRGRVQQATRPSVVRAGKLDDDGPHLAAVGVGAVQHVGRPQHRFAVHHPRPLVAHLHEAPAADDDEEAGVGVVVGRDHGVRAEGQFGDAPASVLVEHLGGDPGGARRPFRAPVAGPEAADVHGRRRAPGPTAADGGGVSGSSPRGACSEPG